MLSAIVLFLFGWAMKDDEGFYVEQKYSPNTFRSKFNGE